MKSAYTTAQFRTEKTFGSESDDGDEVEIDKELLAMKWGDSSFSFGTKFGLDR